MTNLAAALVAVQLDWREEAHALLDAATEALRLGVEEEGDSFAAESDLDAGVPVLAQVHHERSTLLQREERWEEARVAMLAAVEKYAHANWFFELGTIQYKLGKFKLAVNAYVAALGNDKGREAMRLPRRTPSWPWRTGSWSSGTRPWKPCSWPSMPRAGGAPI